MNRFDMNISAVDTNQVIRLYIRKNYPGFFEFLTVNKVLIYDTLITGFEKLAEKQTNRVSVLINATVEGTNWDTTFKLSKARINLLTENILPYFIEIGAFEKCNTIKSLIQKLNQQL